MKARKFKTKAKARARFKLKFKLKLGFLQKAKRFLARPLFKK